MSYIHFDDVSFFRGDSCIYDHTTFSIPNGKITTILGPSGAGKTTILQLISGLIKPTYGSIKVGKTVIDKNTKEKNLAKLRKSMGFLFQSGALFTHLSVYDNIAFPLRKNTKLSEELIKTIVLMKLQAVGLAHTVDMMPSELSGGMARRVALARSIALDPEIMLYDEPFTGQDPTSFKNLLALISTLNKSLKMTSIIVSHDIEESLELSDHIVISSNKKIIASDTPQNIRNSSSLEVQNFLNGESASDSSSSADTNFFINSLLGS